MGPFRQSSRSLRFAAPKGDKGCLAFLGDPFLFLVVVSGKIETIESASNLEFIEFGVGFGFGIKPGALKVDNLSDLFASGHGKLPQLQTKESVIAIP